MKLLTHNGRGKTQYVLRLNEKGGSTIEPREGQKNKAVDKGAWFYLEFAGYLGFTIAMPIAGGALIGNVLDRKWSTYPHATLSLLLVGVVISLLSFIRTVTDIVKRKK